MSSGLSVDVSYLPQDGLAPVDNGNEAFQPLSPKKSDDEKADDLDSFHPLPNTNARSSIRMTMQPGDPPSSAVAPSPSLVGGGGAPDGGIPSRTSSLPSYALIPGNKRNSVAPGSSGLDGLGGGVGGDSGGESVLSEQDGSLPLNRSSTNGMNGARGPNADADRSVSLNQDLDFFVNLHLTPITLLFKFIPPTLPSSAAPTGGGSAGPTAVHPHPLHPDVAGGSSPPGSPIFAGGANENRTRSPARSLSGSGSMNMWTPTYNKQMLARAVREEAEYYKEDAGRFKRILFLLFTWFAEISFICLTAADIYYLFNRKKTFRGQIVDEFDHLCKISQSDDPSVDCARSESHLKDLEKKGDFVGIYKYLNDMSTLEMRVQSTQYREYNSFSTKTQKTIALRAIIIQPLVFFGCTFIMSENFWRKETHLAAAFLYASIYFLASMGLWATASYGVHVFYLIVVIYFTPMRTRTVFVIGLLYALSFFIISVANNLNAAVYSKFSQEAETCTSAACEFCEKTNDTWKCNIPILCNNENFAYTCRITSEDKSHMSGIDAASMVMEPVGVVVFTFVFGIVVKFRRERLLRRNFKTVNITKISGELMAIDEAETDNLLANMTGEYGDKLTMKNKIEQEPHRRRPSDEDESRGGGASASANKSSSSRSIADDDYVESFADVSVIFVEILDFIDIAKKLSPENIVRFLDLFWGTFDDIGKKRKVKMIETSGEIFMACAGCPERVKGHADRAARAAFEMLMEVDKIKAKAKTILMDGEGALDIVQQVQIRIGINTGKIVAGLLDLPTSIRFKLFGDTVNIASKMQKCAPPSHVQISESTHKLLQLSESRLIAQKLSPIYEFSEVCTAVFTSGGRSYDAYRILVAVIEEGSSSEPPVVQSAPPPVVVPVSEENVKRAYRGTNLGRMSYMKPPNINLNMSERSVRGKDNQKKSGALAATSPDSANVSPRLSVSDSSRPSSGVDSNGINSTPDQSAGSIAPSDKAQNGALALPVGMAAVGNNSTAGSAVSSDPNRNRVQRSMITTDTLFGLGTTNLLKIQQEKEQNAEKRYEELKSNHDKLHKFGMTENIGSGSSEDAAVNKDPELKEYLLKHVFSKLLVRDDTELSSEQLVLLLFGTATSAYGFKSEEWPAVKNEVSYLVEETWLLNLNFVRIHCSVWISFFLVYFGRAINAEDQNPDGKIFDPAFDFSKSFHIINCIAVGFTSTCVMMCATFAGQFFYTHNQVLMVSLLVIQGCSVIAEAGLFVPKVGFGSLIILLMSVYQMQLVFFINRVGICCFFVVIYFLAIVQFSTDYGDEALYFGPGLDEYIVLANPRFRIYTPSRVGQLYNASSPLQQHMQNLDWTKFTWDTDHCSEFLQADLNKTHTHDVFEGTKTTKAYQVMKEIVSLIESRVRTPTNYWQVITISEAVTNFGYLAAIAILLIFPYFLADKFERARYNEEIKSREVKTSLEEKKQEKEKMLLKILPQSIVETLAEQNKFGNQTGPGGSIISHHHQKVTIMYCGLVGFTKFANDMDPIELITFLRAFFHTFSEEMRGVFAVEFIGGSVLAIAGAPTPLADPTTTMLKIAVRIINKAKKLSHDIKHPFSIKVGIHSGDIKSGVVGMKMKVPRWNIFGDAVKIAGLMENSCPEGKCHVSQAAWESYHEEETFREKTRGEAETRSGEAEELEFSGGSPRAPSQRSSNNELVFDVMSDNTNVQTALEHAGYGGMPSYVLCEESAFFANENAHGSHRTSRKKAQEAS